MMMTILLCTFKETEDLPNNQAALHEKFIFLVTCISGYIKKLLDKQHSTILSFKTLPSLYIEYLFNLSKFAFESLKK